MFGNKKICQKNTIHSPRQSSSVTSYVQTVNLTMTSQKQNSESSRLDLELHITAHVQDQCTGLPQQTSPTSTKKPERILSFVGTVKQLRQLLDIPDCDECGDEGYVLDDEYQFFRQPHMAKTKAVPCPKCK